MALPREYIGYVGTELAERLEKSGKAKLHDKTAVAERIQQVFTEDFAREDALNQEVRDYLEQHNEQMRRDGIDYQEMYKLIKKELMRKHKISSSRPEADSKL